MAEDQKPKPRPRITTVTYGRTINIGGFETVRIELSAQVDPGGEYEPVLDALKDILDAEEKLVRREFENS